MDTSTRARILPWLIAFGLAVFVATPGYAGAIDFEIWYEFSFTDPGISAAGCDPADPAGGFCISSSGTPSTALDAPAWTFTAPAGGATLAVTDAFLSGDRFDVFDFGVSIGLTSPPAADVDCGDDPVPCLANPSTSHGLFSLGSGDHSITIVPTVTLGGGGAYLQVTAIPEPASMILFWSGLAALALWKEGRGRSE